MWFRRWLKVILLTILLVAAGAISINLLTRHQSTGPDAETQLLEEDVSRRSTEFDYTEFEAGRLIFKVESRTNTLTSAGLHKLEDVRVTVFDSEENVTDEVTGRWARYSIPDRQIEFLDQVEIRLSDSTRIFTDHMLADLEAERILIGGDFRFQRGEVKGEGRGLSYRTTARLLAIESGLEMILPGTPQTRARSQRALYNLESGRLALAGNVNLEKGAERLQSGQLEIVLGPARRVKRMVAVGEAKLQSAGPRHFEGEQIEFFFVDSGRLNRLEIRKGKDQRAVYSQPGRHRLEADRLEVEISSGESGGELRLSSFSGAGRVRLQSAAAGVEEARSASIRGGFGNDELLRDLEMSGGVELWTTQDRLRSKTLSLIFSPNQELEQLTAVGDVTVSSQGSGSRELSTPHRLVADFDGGGQIARVECPQECTIRDEVEKSALQAAHLTARFEDGQPQSVQANGEVKLELNQSGRSQQTFSRRLGLIYQKGKLFRAVQTGDFRLLEEDESGRLEMFSERAEFDPATGLIEVSAPRPSRLLQSQGPDRTIETTANRFWVERESGKLSARGRITSIVADGQGGTVQVRAEQMSAEQAGWVTYTGQPVIEESGSRILGEIVRFRSAEELLVVQGGVDSSFFGADTAQDRSYRILAQKLEYRRRQGRALYEGDVEATSDDLRVESPFLELSFENEGSDRLEQALAWGGVVVSDAQRRAEGNRAIFFPQENRVVVTGDPAHVVDDEQGRAFGARLTFFPGTEKLFIESPASERLP